jgi:hypothetical protein
MGEGAVGLGHLVHVVAFLDGIALAVGGFLDFEASAFSAARPCAWRQPTIQRMASASWRSGGTSIGTW